jgi:YgiT-type zinc finger domain-containing protein
MEKPLKEVKTRYTIEHEGRYYVIENVPARICEETGDELFTPETVEHIQSIIKSEKPLRVMETPVYEYN